MNNQSKLIPFIVGVSIMSLGIIYVAVAFTEPTQSPPQGNVPAPINVSNITQTISDSKTLKMGDGTKVLTISGAMNVSGILQAGSVYSGSQPAVTIGVADVLKGAWIRNNGLDTVFSTNVGNLFLGFSGNSNKVIHIGNVNPGVVQITGSAPSNTFIINRTGNVGIGTTNPTQKLDVAGYVKGREGLCIGDDCRTSWGGGTIQTNIVKTYTKSSLSWFKLVAYCDEGWVRTGCSSYQDDCPEEDCGLHGVVPIYDSATGRQGCEAYFDAEGNITNYVFAYCMKIDNFAVQKEEDKEEGVFVNENSNSGAGGVPIIVQPN